MLSNKKFKQLIFIYREVLKLTFSSRPRLVIFVIFSGILSGLLTVPTLYIDKIILDKMVAGVGVHDWQPVVLMITSLIFLRLLISSLSRLLGNITDYTTLRITDYLNLDIDLKMSKKLTELDMATLEDPAFKNKYERIRQSGGKVWSLVYAIVDIPGSIVSFVSMIIVLISLHPLIAFGAVIVSLPQFFADSKLTKKRFFLDETLAPLYRLRSWVSMYLTQEDNYMELKLLDLPKYLINKLVTIETEIIQKRLKDQKDRNTLLYLSSLPLDIYEVIISALLVFWLVIEKISIGSTQLYIRALNTVQGSLSSLVRSFVRMYEDFVYVSDLVWFLNLKSGFEFEEGGETIDFAQTIEFKNVWFRYKKDQPWIIKNVSFKISPKENLAIVGLNGSGKSTLIKLLARFYDPEKGEILVNNINLKKLNLKSWRKELAILFQEFDAYPFTVRESIGYGDIERINKLTEIKEAAGKTGMREYIESLPLKYQNPLSPTFEKGVLPSTGQRQRLGISRILFRKNSSVIIMDEPTSSVDPKAEEKIFEQLIKEAESKILIFVTQRFSTVRLANRIFVIEEGKIKEQGTHKELLKRKGKYKELFDIQARGYR